MSSLMEGKCVVSMLCLLTGLDIETAREVIEDVGRLLNGRWASLRELYAVVEKKVPPHDSDSVVKALVECGVIWTRCMPNTGEIRIFRSWEV